MKKVVINKKVKLNRRQMGKFGGSKSKFERWLRKNGIDPKKKIEVEEPVGKCYIYLKQKGIMSVKED